MLPELLGQIPPEQEIATVTADGAFDTRKCHDAIAARGAAALAIGLGGQPAVRIIDDGDQPRGVGRPLRHDLAELAQVAVTPKAYLRHDAH